MNFHRIAVSKNFPGTPRIFSDDPIFSKEFQGFVFAVDCFFVADLFLALGQRIAFRVILLPHSVCERGAAAFLSCFFSLRACVRFVFVRVLLPLASLRSLLFENLVP